MGGRRGKIRENDGSRTRSAKGGIDAEENVALCQAASLDQHRTVLRWIYEYCSRHKLEEARDGLVNDVVKMHNISHDELKKDLTIDDPLETLRILVVSGELNNVFQSMEDFFPDADRDPSPLYAKVSKNLKIQIALESLRQESPVIEEFEGSVKLFFPASSKDDLEVHKELMKVADSRKSKNEAHQRKLIEELLQKYPREEFCKQFTELVASYQQPTMLDSIVQDVESGLYSPNLLSVHVDNSAARKIISGWQGLDDSAQPVSKPKELKESVGGPKAQEAEDHAVLSSSNLYLSAWELRDACGFEQDSDAWSMIHQEEHPKVQAFLEEMKQRQNAAKKAGKRGSADIAEGESGDAEMLLHETQPQTQEDIPPPRSRRPRVASAGKENVALLSPQPAANSESDVNGNELQVVKALRDSRHTLRSVVQDPLDNARRVAAGVAAMAPTADMQNIKSKPSSFLNPSDPGRQCEWNTDDESLDESPKTKIQLTSPTSDFKPKPRLGRVSDVSAGAGDTRKRWTAEETENLKKGVERHGSGKWARILADFEFQQGRSQVDLKDKWRNLEKHGHI